MPDITSRQHPIVHAFKAAARNESDRALLDGWHLLHDAVDAGVEIAAVAISGPPPTARETRLLDRLARQCEVFTVTTAVMNALSPVRTPAGVVSLAVRRAHHLTDLLHRDPALLLIAADIQDPGNAGAIVRSAEAGGCTGILFVGTSADPWGWKALRAAMGSTFRVPLIRGEAASIVESVRRAGVRLIATVPHHGTPMHRVDMCAPLAFMLGAEGSGLDESMLRSANERATIPMQPPVESLNVAVAAALLIYEARRQRGA